MLKNFPSQLKDDLLHHIVQHEVRYCHAVNLLVDFFFFFPVCHSNVKIVHYRIVKKQFVLDSRIDFEFY